MWLRRWCLLLVLPGVSSCVLKSYSSWHQADLKGLSSRAPALGGRFVLNGEFAQQKHRFSGNFLITDPQHALIEVVSTLGTAIAAVSLQGNTLLWVDFSSQTFMTAWPYAWNAKVASALLALITQDATALLPKTAVARVNVQDNSTQWQWPESTGKALLTANKSQQLSSFTLSLGFWLSIALSASAYHSLYHTPQQLLVTFLPVGEKCNLQLQDIESSTKTAVDTQLKVPKGFKHVIF